MEDSGLRTKVEEVTMEICIIVKEQRLEEEPQDMTKFCNLMVKLEEELLLWDEQKKGLK